MVSLGEKTKKERLFVRISRNNREDKVFEVKFVCLEEGVRNCVLAYAEFNHEGKVAFQL